MKVIYRAEEPRFGGKDKTMRFEFIKIQCSGNDYICVDCSENAIACPSEIARRLCLRRFSVGADGLVLVFPSEIADARIEIFNADGSEAKMCGNAIRGVAKYLYESGKIKKTELLIETVSGAKQLFLITERGRVDRVKINMGPVKILPYIKKIIFENKEYFFRCVLTGNFHAVTFVGNVRDFPVERIGSVVENSSLFSENPNVEFIRASGGNEIEMRVWEKGSGETYSCGTGAVAAAAVFSAEAGLSEPVTVHVRGGDLRVFFEKDGSAVLSGDVRTVYHGIYDDGEDRY